MTDISLVQVQEAVKRARNQVVGAGVMEDTDLVTVTLAAVNLLRENATPSNGHAKQTVAIPLPETFAEWATGFQLENHSDRFLATLMYLFEKSEMKSATTDDILQLYKKARWEMPKNPADVMAKTAKRLLLTEDEDNNGGDDGKKRWRLTSTGYTHFLSLRKGNSYGE